MRNPTNAKQNISILIEQETADKTTNRKLLNVQKKKKNKVIYILRLINRKHNL